MSLDGGENFAWLMLRKVKAGRVARCGGYLEDGFPMGVLLADIAAVLTEAGAARYAALCRLRRSRLPTLPEQHRGTESPAGHRAQGAAPPAVDRPDPPAGALRCSS